MKITKLFSRTRSRSGVERALAEITAALTILKTQGVKIMAKLDDFLAAQAAYNAEIGAAIDGIVADVAELNRIISELGDGTTEEQEAKMDELTAAGAALVARVKAADELTPPATPAP